MWVCLPRIWVTECWTMVNGCQILTNFLVIWLIKTAMFLKKNLATENYRCYITLFYKVVTDYLRSLLDVTDGQTLTTYWEAIFCMYTHMKAIWNISYMSLAFDVIKGHQKSNLYIWRSNLNDNTQRCMYTHKTNKNDVSCVNLSSKTIKSPWRSI